MSTIRKASLKGMAVVGAALVALTGCSSDTKKDASDTASKAASGASSVASSASGAASSGTPSTSPSDASSAGGESSSAASSASSSSAGAGSATSGGSQVVKAPVAKVSFDVPSGWIVIDQANSKNKDVLKKLEPFAKRQSTSPEHLAQGYMGLADAVALDPSSTGPVSDSINVLKITQPSTPTEAQYAKEFKKIGAKTEKYSKIETPAGQGAQETYSLTARGVSLHGVSICLPNGDGSYATVTATSPDAKKVEQYAKTIAASAHKL